MWQLKPFNARPPTKQNPWSANSQLFSDCIMVVYVVRKTVLWCYRLASLLTLLAFSFLTPQIQGTHTQYRGETTTQIINHKQAQAWRDIFGILSVVYTVDRSTATKLATYISWGMDDRIGLESSSISLLRCESRAFDRQAIGNRSAW